MSEKKQLTFFDLFTLGLGGAIGSGIFVLLSVGIAYTGRSIVLGVLGGCVIMLLAYFYNILLSSMFTFKGGNYSQQAFLFGPYATGLSAMFILLSGCAIAVYGLSMVEYASIIFPAILPYKKLAAVLGITIFFAASIRGTKFISKINSVMTVVLIIAIGSFIVFGLPQVKAGFFSGDDFFMKGPMGFFMAISIMGWACQGATSGPVSVAGVTKNPQRTVPLAILAATAVLALIYGLMSTVASGVLPIEALQGQNLSSVSQQIFPRWVHVLFILGGGVFAIATSLITVITMLGAPIRQISVDGWLPKVFLKQTAGGFSWFSQLVFYLLAVVPILLDFSLSEIVSLIMIPSMLMKCYLNFKCLKVIKEYPVQWQNSLLHMPKLAINSIILLACASNLFICYFLVIDLTLKSTLIIGGAMAVLIGLAVIRLKTGAVLPENLAATRQQIISDALAESEEVLTEPVS